MLQWRAKLLFLIEIDKRKDGTDTEYLKSLLKYGRKMSRTNIN